MNTTMSVKKREKHSEELTLLNIMQDHNYALNNDNPEAETGKRKQKECLTVEHHTARQTEEHRSYVALEDKFRSSNSRQKSNETGTQKSTITSGELAVSSTTNASPLIIKSEMFDIIEIEETCIQNNPVAVNGNPIMEQSASLTLLNEEDHRTHSTKRKRTLAEETLVLIKLQQEFYQNENIRAAEMHHMRRELLELKKELIEVQIKLRADACIKIEEDSS